MTEILHHLGCIKPVNNGINYQPQLVSLSDFSHQQYDHQKHLMYVTSMKTSKLHTLPASQVQAALGRQVAQLSGMRCHLSRGGFEGGEETVVEWRNAGVVKLPSFGGIKQFKCTFEGFLL